MMYIGWAIGYKKRQQGVVGLFWWLSILWHRMRFLDSAAVFTMLIFPDLAMT